MPLRNKILLIVTTVVALYAGLDHWFQRLWVSPSFAALEREEAEQDLERVIEAIETEIYHLDLSCKDWATWDDTYEFVARPDARYKTSNLGPGSFADDQINLLYLCDVEGRVVWGDIRDLETGERLSMKTFPPQQMHRNHPFLVESDLPRSGLNPQAQRGYVSGLIVTEQGPMLLSCRPILDSRGQGPVRGTVILGRLLSPTLVSSISRATRVSFQRWSLNAPDLPAAEREVIDEAATSVRPVVREFDDSLLHVYSTFPDVNSRPVLLLRADVERDISARGSTLVRYALLSTVAAGLLLLLVLLGVLQRTVLAPIARLTEHAVYIGRTEDSSSVLHMDRKDEIGILSREFDGMLQKLAQSRGEVVKAARSAGMSEIATGILHNVGNVLNSVNVSVTLVSEKVRNSKLAKLTRLTEMVEAHKDDLGDFIRSDPKGQHVAPYLSELTRLMQVEQRSVVEEVESLNKGIEHIRQLVNSQQGYAMPSELREVTSLPEVLDEALEMTDRALEPDGTRVVREYGPLPALRVDRHKLLELLVNLITNARQAMLELPGEQRVLTLRLAQQGEQVRIEVADQGVGIPPENIARIFTHGFTTKKDGHGFGLHASANAAVELRGRLVATSDGPGRGASFVLTLPLQAEEAARPRS